MRKQLATIALSLAFLTQCACAGARGDALPARVANAVADQQAARGSPMKIEDCTFDGKRAFLFTRLDAAEARDADTLYDGDGKPLCRFGAFAPPSAANACGAKKLICHRTLHPVK